MGSRKVNFISGPNYSSVYRSDQLSHSTDLKKSLISDTGSWISFDYSRIELLLIRLLNDRNPTPEDSVHPYLQHDIIVAINGLH